MFLPSWELDAATRAETPAWLDQLVKELASAARCEFPETHIVSDCQLNAFVRFDGPTPRPQLGFTSQLVNEFTVDEIRATAAHEIAHIATRHRYQRYLNSIKTANRLILGLSLLAVLLSTALFCFASLAAGLVGFFGPVLCAYLIRLSYGHVSQSWELEADRIAVGLVGGRIYAQEIEHLARGSVEFHSKTGRRRQRQLALLTVPCQVRRWPRLLIYSTHPPYRHRITLALQAVYPI